MVRKSSGSNSFFFFCILIFQYYLHYINGKRSRLFNVCMANVKYTTKCMGWLFLRPLKIVHVCVNQRASKVAESASLKGMKICSKKYKFPLLLVD